MALSLEFRMNNAAMLKSFFRFAYIYLLLVGGASSSAFAETDEDGRYWLSAYAQGKLSTEPLYWSMDTHVRWRDEGQHFDQLILRPAVFFKFQPHASVWLGYDTAISHPAGQSASRENRLWQQFQYQFEEVANVTVISRTRLEQRRREDVAELGHRLRQMVRVSVPSAVHANLSWVAFDELFVNLNQTEWGVQRGIDQNRLFVGVNWKINHASNVDAGYLNQWVNTRTVDRENHVLMTTFRFSF